MPKHKVIDFALIILSLLTTRRIRAKCVEGELRSCIVDYDSSWLYLDPECVLYAMILKYRKRVQMIENLLMNLRDSVERLQEET